VRLIHENYQGTGWSAGTHHCFCVSQHLIGIKILVYILLCHIEHCWVKKLGTVVYYKEKLGKIGDFYDRIDLVEQLCELYVIFVFQSARFRIIREISV
jgi:hypothetical protein